MAGRRPGSSPHTLPAGPAGCSAGPSGIEVHDVFGDELRLAWGQRAAVTAGITRPHGNLLARIAVNNLRRQLAGHFVRLDVPNVRFGHVDLGFITEELRLHLNPDVPIVGSSHKCVHDLGPGRSATAVGRRCGCARARYATAQSSVAQSTAACAGPALGGGPARRQPDQTQAADSMALTRRRTVKDRRTQPRLSPTFYARAEPSLTVQPRWNWQPRHDSAACCGRTFREPATPLQIQTVFFSHVSH